MSSVTSSRVSNDQTLNQVNLHLSTIDHSVDASFNFRAIKGNKIESFSNVNDAWQSNLLALIQQGYELFVVVNDSDGHGVKTKNITKVRSLFLDLDDTSQDNLAVIEQMPIAPNLVIRTSPGKYHCYWNVVDCPLNQFTGIQKALAEKYNGDSSVSDLPRIMRLAGSIHLKGKPHQVTILEHHEDTYTFDEFKQKFNFGSFGSPIMGDFNKKNEVTKLDRNAEIERLTLNIKHGNQLHESLLSLAGYCMHDGMTQESVVSKLRLLLSESKAPRDARFNERYNGIPSSVKYVFDTRSTQAFNPTNANEDNSWSEPQELVSELKPVKALDVSILPKIMQGVISDAARRMQCPPDFLAVGLIVTASSIVARRVAVQPKKFDTGWIEHPNLWGFINGKPSLLKSPTLSIAMTPLEELERQSHEEHKEVLKEHSVECEIADLSEKKNKSEVKKLIKVNNYSEAKAILMADKVDDEEAPTQIRYVVNDGTIEKIIDLQCSNHKGLLVYRDELSGWFNNLNKPDKTNDRAVFLEAWNGNKPYIVDRMARGTTYVPTNRLSILGGIQPDLLNRIFIETMSGSQGGDGLLQRFQVAVYPDIGSSVNYVDEAPNKAAMEMFNERIYALSEWSNIDDNNLTLKLTDDASDVFKKWHIENDKLLRRDTVSPALESHFAKYRGLVPSLAAIFYVLENESFESNPFIDKATLECAIAYTEYLRSHAERMYSLPESGPIKETKALLKQFDKLPNTFTARDIYKGKFPGLKTSKLAEAAIAVLEEHGYCKPEIINHSGVGRPSNKFVKHPKYRVPKLPKVEETPQQPNKKCSGE